MTNPTPKEKAWIWMMDYCKQEQIPPAQEWAWDEAKFAYVKNMLTKTGNKTKPNKKEGSCST